MTTQMDKDAFDEWIKRGYEQALRERIKSVRRKQAQLIILLAVGAFGCGALMAWALFGRTPRPAASALASSAVATPSATPATPPLALTMPRDDAFAARVRRDGLLLDNSALASAAAVGSARAVCDEMTSYGWTRSREVHELWSHVVGPHGWTVDQTHTFVGDAADAYCPEVAP